MEKPSLIRKESFATQALQPEHKDKKVSALTRTKSTFTPTLFPKDDDFPTKQAVKMDIVLPKYSQLSPSATKITDAFWPLGKPPTLAPAQSPAETDR